MISEMVYVWHPESEQVWHPESEHDWVGCIYMCIFTEVWHPESEQVWHPESEHESHDWVGRIYMCIYSVSDIWRELKSVATIVTNLLSQILNSLSHSVSPAAVCQIF